jgi:beta propeller repeat protein
MKKNVLIITVIGVVVVLAVGAVLATSLFSGKEVNTDCTVSASQELYNPDDINETGEGYDVCCFSVTFENSCTMRVQNNVHGHEFLYSMEDSTGNVDVYLYNIDSDTHTRITNSDAYETRAILSEDYIFFVHKEINPQNNAIYMYNRNTSAVTLVENLSTDYGVPRVFTNDLFVYVTYDMDIADKKLTSKSSCIKTYDSVSQTIETIVEVDCHIHSLIEADGEKLVWADGRNGNLDIFMYDLDTGIETTICDDPNEQRWPCIAGDLVVWEDHRNDYNNDDPGATPPIYDHDYGDIYGYIISTGTEIGIDTTTGMSSFSPALSYNSLNNCLSCVHLNCECGSTSAPGTIQLTTFSLPLPSPPTIRPITPWLSKKTDPRISGNWVFWGDDINADATYPSNSDTFFYSIYDDEIAHLESSDGGSIPIRNIGDLVLLGASHSDSDILYGAIISRSVQ